MEVRFLRLPIPWLLTVVVIVIAAAGQAAHFLVVSQPQKSDAIVVLAGETNTRPALGLELLRRGMAQHVFMDAETRNRVYDTRLFDIARSYVSRIPEADRVSVCPIFGTSTLAEADDVGRCLQPLAAHRVLIVTSDSHTRRALAIFRRRLPQYQFSVTGAVDPELFGDRWWTHREWAKTTCEEWAKLAWWEAVDRWR